MGEPTIKKLAEDLNTSSTSSPPLENDVMHCLKSLAYATHEVNSGVYPIITVKCKGQSLHLLMDTDSDCIPVTREAVKRTSTASYESDIICIDGLANKVTTSSDEFATLELEFGSGIIPIRALIVNMIGSLIHMTNPSFKGQLKNVPLTMDFGG